MARKRTGGSGRTGTLRQQFNYYKKQVNRRMIEEQAFIEARGGMSFAGKPPSTFERYDFNDIFERGITRKNKKGQTVRIKGEEAIKIQIESFRKRASKSYMASQYINNYTKVMKEKGYSAKEVESVKRKLESISIDKLSLIIDNGSLPQLQFLYSSENKKETLENIMEAIDPSNPLAKQKQREELKRVRDLRNKLIPIVKMKSELSGWML